MRQPNVCCIEDSFELRSCEVSIFVLARVFSVDSRVPMQGLVACRIDKQSAYIPALFFRLVPIAVHETVADQARRTIPTGNSDLSPGSYTTVSIDSEAILASGKYPHRHLVVHDIKANGAV